MSARDETKPTIRTWERVQDVLDDVRRDHERLAEWYARMHGDAADERTRLLLQLRVERERAGAAALATYADELDERLRNTRIQFRPKRDLASLLAGTDTARPTIETVTRVGMEVDEYFEHLFDGLQAVASSGGALELQQVFAGLRDRQRVIKQLHARQANTAGDV